MTDQEKTNLKVEIQHIFDSGANEIRIFNMVQALMDRRDEAIDFTRCSTQLPDKLQPVLAKIEHINSLGKSSWYEVVYNDGNWQSYQGSKTFEDGEKVVKWKYCKAIV